MARIALVTLRNRMPMPNGMLELGIRTFGEMTVC